MLAPSFLQVARVGGEFRGHPGGNRRTKYASINLKAAYTGEVSPLQLREVATWVILGHSERRQFFADEDDAVHRKLRAALDYGLRPIICMGEALEDREAGRTEATLYRQLHVALSGVPLPSGTGLGL